MQKRLSLLLAALLALCLSGCGELPEAVEPAPETNVSTTNPDQNEQSAVKQEIALAYSHDDTLNPFSAKTEVNGQLTGLLYEGLMTVGEDFVPTERLAGKVEQTDATHLTVTLREGAVFADGKAVTAADVTASFKVAKASGRYRRLLQNVSSATVKGDAVVFSLTGADPNSVAALVFPVVKASTLTDKAGEAPLGTGPYVVTATKTGHQLKKNPHYAGTVSVESVALRHLPNRTARQHGLSSGEISYCFDDMSEGDIPRMSGASRSVAMNDLVFLGVNANKDKLKDASVRKALSLLLNREEVVTGAYSGWATASANPFHPIWKPMKEVPGSAAADVDTALALLDEAGCTPKKGKRLELELIYSTDRVDRAKVADAIRTQLEVGGVAILPVPLEEKEYLERLKSGKYDLYVGEIRLTADHSLRPLLMGGEASYGISRTGAATAAYRHYLSGDSTLAEFVEAFGEDMPYIPLCWRDGMASYDRRLTAVTPTGYDPYAGFADWQ